MIYFIGALLFIAGFACHASISSRVYDKGHEDGLEFGIWLSKQKQQSK